MISRGLCLGLTVVLGWSLVVCCDASADDAAYVSMIKERAAAAEKAGNVQGMIECAYALYPIEFATKAEKPRHAALIKAAAAQAIESKNAEQAKLFLELAGPLSHAVAPKQFNALETLALGKTADELDEAAKKKAAEASKPIKKHGPDIADPNVKVRGAGEREFCEAITGMALGFYRPSCVLGKGCSPTMTRHSVGPNRWGELEVSAHWRWCGMWTGNVYDSDVTIIFSIEPMRVVRIDYDDDCPTPCENLKKTGQLIRQINSNL